MSEKTAHAFDNLDWVALILTCIIYIANRGNPAAANTLITNATVHKNFEQQLFRITVMIVYIGAQS